MFLTPDKPSLISSGDILPEVSIKTTILNEKSLVLPGKGEIAGKFCFSLISNT